jgi:hypothetical protein
MRHLPELPIMAAMSPRSLRHDESSTMFRKK